MTDIDHLKLIRARCMNLLTQAKGPSEKFVMPQGYVGKNAVKGEHYRSGYMAGFAACSTSTKAAEAGWRATIAAIDALEKVRAFNAPMGSLNPSMAMVASYTEANEAIKSILAAWPLELLKEVAP